VAIHNGVLKLEGLPSKRLGIEFIAKAAEDL
jgi:hypothetical protein